MWRLFAVDGVGKLAEHEYAWPAVYERDSTEATIACQLIIASKLYKEQKYSLEVKILSTQSVL